MEPKKTLSCTQGVQAAVVLFTLNAGREGILRLAAQADLFRDVPAEALPAARERVLEEWRAFVHASVVYGLMHRAPNIVVAEYLRGTRALLAEQGYDAAGVEAFVDGPFAVYMELLVQERQKDCPGIFFRRVLPEEPMRKMPSGTVALISGVMAMTLCAVIDKLDGYDIRAE